jgi:hypothetical protein
VFLCSWRQLVNALYSNAILSPLAARPVPSTDIRYVCGLKGDTIAPPAVSSTKYPFYRVPRHGNFVAVKASSLQYILWALQCSRTLCISEPTWAFLVAYSLTPCVPGPYDRHVPMKWFLYVYPKHKDFAIQSAWSSAVWIFRLRDKHACKHTTSALPLQVACMQLCLRKSLPKLDTACCIHQYHYYFNWHISY